MQSRLIAASLVKASRFTNDAAGIEKILRLLQSISQVIGPQACKAQAASWDQARQQLALGRRYIRFAKFIDAFRIGYDTFPTKSPTASTILTLIDALKWTFLGLFLFLESCTILHAMGLSDAAWGPAIYMEAMRFWMYSIVCSVMLSLVGLARLYARPSLRMILRRRLFGGGFDMGSATFGDANGLGRVKGEPSTPRACEKAALYEAEALQKRRIRNSMLKRLVVDLCDITTPLRNTGVFVLGPVTVGGLGIVSTVLSAGDVWREVQGR